MSQILEPFLNYFLIDNINYKIFIITLSFLFFIVFKNYLSKIYLNFILKLFRIDKSRLNQNIHSLINYQIKIFLLFIPLYIFFSIYDFYPYLNLILQNILKSFFIIIIFHFIFFLSNNLLKILSDQVFVEDKGMQYWAEKIFIFLITFFCVYFILKVWGIDLAPILAGLGLFGVAVALGAKDFFQNLISGIQIILEKNLKVGDYIKVDENIEGTILQISLRSTIIRLLDTSEMSFPNSYISEKPIINFNKRQFRRTNKLINLIYDTQTSDIRNILNETYTFLKKHEKIKYDDSYHLIVKLNNFGESSIDLYLSYFINSPDWESYLSINEEILIKIREIVTKNNSDFAYPTQTVYLKN